MKFERSKSNCLVYKGSIYIFCGLSPNPDYSNICERYNIEKNIWEEILYEGYDYPSLTGAGLTNPIVEPNLQNILLFGGTNYYSSTELVQTLNIYHDRNSFEMNVTGSIQKL